MVRRRADGSASAPSRGHEPTWQSVRILLLGLVLARGVVLLSTLPIFEGWDEYQHVAVVDHVAQTGAMPKLEGSEVDPEFLRRVVAYPQPDYALDQIAHLGAMSYETFWLGSGLGQPDPDDPSRDWSGIHLYQAQHGPLYYHLAAPIYQWFGGRDDLLSSVSCLRLLNVLCLVGAVWIALGTVDRLAPNRVAASLVGLAIAVQPLFLMNGARVANDALGVLFATVAVTRLMEIRPSRFVFDCGVAGLAIGLATLAKSVHLGLVPFAAAWGIGLAWRHRDVLTRRRILAGGVVMALAASVVVGPNLVTNVQLYGGLTPMQEAVKNRRDGLTTADLLDAAKRVPWAERLESFWFREPLEVGAWSFLRPSWKWISRHALVMKICLVGLIAGPILRWLLTRIRTGRFKSPPLEESPGSLTHSIDGSSGRTRLILAGLGLCVSYTMALSYHIAHSQLAWGRPTTNAWYAAACYPWLCAAVVLGGLSWSGRRIGRLLVLSWIVVMVVGESLVVFGLMPSIYAAGGSGWTAIERLGQIHPAWLGPGTWILGTLGSILLVGLAVTKVLVIARAEDRNHLENREAQCPQPHQRVVKLTQTNRSTAPERSESAEIR